MSLSSCCTVRGMARAATMLAALLSSPPAGAAVTLRHQLDLRGDFRLFGNTLAQDWASGVVPPAVGSLCTTGGGGTCGGNTTDSGADVFWRADPAAGTAACSSTITAAAARSVSMLQLPAGAVVKYARLYWSGYVSSNAFDPTATLTTPDGSAHPVAADVGWTLATAVDNGRWWYQSSAEVTALLQALPAAPGAYLVSDVDSIPLAGVNSEVAFTGWWAVVFYEDPAEITLRNLTLFDGFEGVSSGAAATATLAGFRVPGGGFDAKLGVVAWEGDSNVTGDQLKFKGYTAPDAPPATLVNLTDALNPATNFFNRSRSQLGVAVSVAGDLPQTTGAAASLSGMDLDVVDLKANGAIVAGNDSATISATSSGDVYVLGGFVTSVSTLRPDFAATVKSVANVDRTGATLAGDRLEYTVTARNAGNDPSIQTVLVDALPPGVTLVPGSIRIASGANPGGKSEAAGDDQADYDDAARTLTVRLGAGATAFVGGSLAIGESTVVVFRVTVDAGAAGTIDNLASVTAAGQSGEPSAGFPTQPPSGGGGATSQVIDACITDASCGGATPACDVAPAPNLCVACTADAHCGGTTPVCDLAGRACVGRTAVLPASQERPAAPGLAVPFELEVRSALTASERYDLDVLDGGCAAAVELRDGAGQVLAARDASGSWTMAAGNDTDGDGRPELAAPSQGTVPFTLRLSQAAGAAMGDRCQAQVVATGFTTGAADPAQVAVRAAAAVTFTPDRTGPDALAVITGGTVAFAGVIRNSGAAESAFSLAATVTATPSAGTLAAAQFWSDPDGDGSPADGAPITVTGPVAPFGGAVPVVLVVRASAASGAPLDNGTMLATSATATASVGGAGATQLGQAWVGWIAPSSEAAFATTSQVFAPCQTVHVRAQRLPLADGYALEWYAGGAPVRGTDQPLRAVDPWPVTGGSATDAYPLPAGAPDAITVLLVQRIGATTAVLDALQLGVERGGAIAGLAAPARIPMGQALSATATFRSDALRVTHRDTRLAWTVSGGGLAMDGAGDFLPPPATARLLAGPDATPGSTLADTLSAIPAWPAPGRYHVNAAWQLSCGAAPALAEGGADVDVAPTAPVVTSPAAGALVASPTPDVTGTALPGASVAVSIDGAALAPVVADGAGQFTVSVPASSPLAEGAHLLVAVQTAGGVASDASPPRAFSVSLARPSLQLASPEPGALLDGADAPLGQVSFAGTAEAGAEVVLLVDGAAAPVLRSGTAFSAAVTLADGPHLAVVTATAATGLQTVLTVPFDLDVAPPAPPQVSAPAASQLLGGALAPAGLVAFTGTAEPGATVTVTAGAASASALAGADGGFTASLLLADGDHQASLTASDAAGNAAAPATIAFRLDTLPPATPAIVTPSPGARLPPAPTRIAGTAEPGASVRVAAGALATTVTADAGGAFETTFPLPAGSWSAAAVATDAAGNGSPEGRVAFDVAPLAPVVASPAAGALLASATPAIAGSALPGASVTVSIDGAALAPVVADGAGQFTVSVPASSPLAEGAHLLVAVQTAGGVASDASPARAFTTDSVPPALQLASPTPGALLGGADAPLGQVGFTGAAESGATVALVVDGVSVAVARTGSAFSAVATLADGPHVVAVTATDAAGNPAVLTVPFELDVAPPAPPQVSAPAAGQLLGGALAPAGLVAFTGTAEPGATVTVTAGAASASALAGADGGFTASLLLADGDHQASLTASDAAGNAAAPAAVAFRLDTLPPAAPVIHSPAGGAVVPVGSLAVTGTAEPGAAVHVFIGAASSVGVAGVDGTFSAPFQVPSAGAMVAVATATDAAGNGSAPAQVGFVVAADAAPAAPPKARGGGCGCSQGAGAASGSSLLLLALAACWPRRRETRSGRRG